MKTTKNQEVISGIVAGDTTVIKAFYKKNLPYVRTFITRQGGSMQDVEDIFQDALVLIYHKGRKGTIDISASIHTYFIGICRNKWYMQVRMQQRLIHDDAKIIDAAATDVSITEAITKQEQAALYDKHYHTLSEANKTLLQLFFDGHSMREIANRMGYSEGYTRKKKYEIKKYLTSLIQNDTMYSELAI